MNKYKLYIDICKKQLNYIVFGVFMLITEAVIVLVTPFLMNNVMDALFSISESTYRQFMRNFAIFICLLVSQIVISYFSSVIFKIIGIKNTKEMLKRLVKRIYYSITRTPPQFNPQEALQTINNDVFGLGEKGITIIYKILHLLINIFAISFYIWRTSFILSATITVIFILIMLLQYKINKKMESLIEEMRRYGGEFYYNNSNLVNNYFEYRKIKAYNYVVSKSENNSNFMLGKSYQIERLMYFNIFVNGLGNALNIILAFGIGAMQIINGNLTLGSLVTFNMYANIFGGHLVSIPSIFKSLKDFNVSYRRTVKIMQIDVHEQTDTESVHAISNIKFENVSFRYNQSNGSNIINDFSLDLNNGNIYCITGQNGAGKSTLLNIIAGEYPINEGNITISDRKIDLHKEKLKIDDYFTYFSSSYVLFNDSVRNNILVGKNISDSLIFKLYDVFKIDKNDSDLNLDKRINESHQNLSDGQKQKLCLMRSFVEDKKVMILDEPEKHLDSKAKESLMQYLKSVKQDKIIIIVSHDDYVQTESDAIIKL